MAGKHWTLLACGSLAFGSLALGSLATSESNQDCRCFPGEECWPSTDVWNQFNQTLEGRLIATVPLATPCHAPNYDAAACDKLREQWTDPALQYVHPSDVHPSLRNRCQTDRKNSYTNTEHAAMKHRGPSWHPSSPMARVTLSIRCRSRVRWDLWSAMP